MSISEKTRVNVTLASFIAVFLWLVYAAYSMGAVKSSMTDKVENNSKIITSHLVKCDKEQKEIEDFKMTITNRLTRIEQLTENNSKNLERIEQKIDKL